MPLSSSIRLLKIACSVTVFFGTVMIFALFTPLSSLLNLFVDAMHWPVDGKQAIDTETERTLIAILGGIMIGLAAFVWQITTHVYRQNPTRGMQMITISLLAWYIPDSLGSVLTDAWINVVMNSVFLALFLAPIYLAKKSYARVPT